ncbi:MAG TPA: MFS transporter [Streptosporangiaceae bacterium]|jgi:predicted MFS family arabinose efflux permease
MSSPRLTYEPAREASPARPAGRLPRHAAARPRGRRFQLPARGAFLLQASITVFFLAGSAAPTPLYALYQREWGFSPITTTVVFGVYAVAVLVALLVVGSLSDHIGRRPVLLAAIAVQAATMVLYATASSVPALLAARVIQGLATGAAVGAVGAGLVDLHRSRGTVANAVAPVTGTATGAIGAGLLVQYLPDPAHLVYLVLLGIFVVQWIGVALMAESATPKPGALSALRPRISVPAALRGPVLAAIPALIAVWSLASFYGSLGPALIGRLAGSQSAVLGGLALAVLAGAGAVSILAVRAAPARLMLLLGMTALLAGVGVTLLAVAISSVGVLLAGTTVAGMGFGAGFQGAIRTVLPLAAAHERAGVLSTLFVVSYLGLGLPGVIAGYLVVHGGGLLASTRQYAVAVMILAALAILGLARRPRGQAAGRPAGTMAAQPVPAPEPGRALAACGTAATED